MAARLDRRVTAAGRWFLPACRGFIAAWYPLFDAAVPPAMESAPAGSRRWLGWTASPQARYLPCWHDPPNLWTVRSGGHHAIPHPRQPGRRRQARPAARRPQRAGARRQDHRPDPHRAPVAHDPRTRRQGRQGHRLQPFRPAQGQARAGDVARPDGRGARRGAGPARALRRGLHRRRRRAGGGAHGARRRAGAGEHPLPRRRGEERSRPSPPSWRSSPTSTSTTRSPRRIARTPAPRAWRTCCPPMPAG